jgi:UDP-glucose 4-epimerase
MTNILITGGCGFIGSHLVDSYCRDGHTVIILDNLSSGRQENISRWIHSDIYQKRLFLYIKDISQHTVCALIESHRIDIIHHVAARPRVGYSIDHPLESNDENITNTVRVLDAARMMGRVKRVIYSASSSAYGTATMFPTSETAPVHPLSPYALQKHVGEEYCRLFSELYGLDTVSLRYFNVFGPRSLADSQYSAVIPIFVQQIMKGESVTIDGLGEQSRDFTYVENVVQGNRLAATYQGRLGGKVLNIACSNNISINQLVSKLEVLLGAQAQKIYGAPRPGDAFKTQADISQATAVLGYYPVVSFDEGLDKTIKWYVLGEQK